MFTEGGHRRGRPDHNVRPRTSCRLHDSVHEYGHIDSIQKARKVRASHLLILVSILNRCMVLHLDGVHVRIHPRLRVGSIHAV